MSLSLEMKETNLTVNYDRPPLKGVRFATLRLFANGEEVDLWEYFSYDESTSIYDWIALDIDEHFDPMLRFTIAGELRYGSNYDPIPDTIANSDGQFGVGSNSRLVRLIGDKIPLLISKRPGSTDFECIDRLEYMFEPQWVDPPEV
jgi:hypothetical protein